MDLGLCLSPYVLYLICWSHISSFTCPSRCYNIWKQCLKVQLNFFLDCFPPHPHGVTGRVPDPVAAAYGRRQDTHLDEPAAHCQALFEHLGVLTFLFLFFYFFFLGSVCPWNSCLKRDGIQECLLYCVWHFQRQCQCKCCSVTLNVMFSSSERIETVHSIFYCSSCAMKH